MSKKRRSTKETIDWKVLDAMLLAVSKDALHIAHPIVEQGSSIPLTAIIFHPKGHHIYFFPEFGMPGVTKQTVRNRIHRLVHELNGIVLVTISDTFWVARKVKDRTELETLTDQMEKEGVQNQPDREECLLATIHHCLRVLWVRQRYERKQFGVIWHKTEVMEEGPSTEIHSGFNPWRDDWKEKTQ